MISTKQVDIQPTEHQSQAIREIMAWVLDRGSYEPLTFVGAAGTGKTFTLNKVLMQVGHKLNITVSAPTHKAKKVISEVVQREAMTIHSALGLSMNVDLEAFDSTNPLFDEKNEPKILGTNLWIIDEASMLNYDLTEKIAELCKTYSIKVLFVGDKLQLPPVWDEKKDPKPGRRKNFSPALNYPNRVELTEIIRQKDTNPIAELLIRLRDDMENNTDTFYAYLLANRNMMNDIGEGYTTYKTNEEFFNIALPYYQSDIYKEDRLHCKYMAFTNVSVDGFNKLIRQAITGSEDKFVVGDFIMSYNSVSVKDEDTGRPTMVITNSEDYNITKCYRMTDTRYGISGWKVSACNAYNTYDYTDFFVVDEDDEIFNEELNTLLRKARKFKGQNWINYYNFKNKYLLSANIYEDEDVERLKCKKDLDYGHAITIHKSQGSTYEHVFINLRNINEKCFDVDMRRRLTYVAISRCKTSATFLL